MYDVPLRMVPSSVPHLTSPHLNSLTSPPIIICKTEGLRFILTLPDLGGWTWLEEGLVERVRVWRTRSLLAMSRPIDDPPSHRSGPFSRPCLADSGWCCRSPRPLALCGSGTARIGLSRESQHQTPRTDAYMCCSSRDLHPRVRASCGPPHPAPRRCG